MRCRANRESNISSSCRLILAVRSESETEIFGTDTPDVEESGIFGGMSALPFGSDARSSCCTAARLCRVIIYDVRSTLLPQRDTLGRDLADA